MSEKKKRKKNRGRYPGLNKNQHVKTRYDFIETEYVDGVKDQYGDRVIRPLDDKEKDFLSKFNEEYYGCNFTNDPETRKIEDKLNSMKSSLKDVKEPTESEMTLLGFYQMRLLDEMDQNCFNNTPQKRRDRYTEDNKRRKCMLNVAKAGGVLDSYEEEIDVEVFYNDEDDLVDLLITEVGAIDD